MTPVKGANLIIDGNEEDAENRYIFNPHRLDDEDFYYLTEIKNIRSILPWIIMILGVIGNTLILVIFLKSKSRRTSSTGFCFCALAISDLMALIFMLLRSMLKLQVLGNLSAACKLVKFIYYFSLQLSSWCLVLLTIDRLIAVVFIFKYNTWSKKWHALKFLVVIILSLFLINMHLLIFVSSFDRNIDTSVRTRQKFLQLSQYNMIFYQPSQLVQFNDVPRYICYCDQDRFPNYNKLIYSKWDIYHSVIYGAVPFVIVLISNLIIILKLTFLKSEQNKLTKTSQLRERSSIKSTQITVMLLSIAFLFLIFTSPISIYMTFFYDNLTGMKESKREYIKVVLRYLAYWNNAINFYIYLCLSSEFRKEFFKCFGFKKVVTTCTTKTTTLGSNNMLNNERMDDELPRRGMIYKGENNYHGEQPFIQDYDYLETNEPHMDAVERYKQNTRNAKLTYYKSKNINSDFNKSEKNINEPFINSYSSYV